MKTYLFLLPLLLLAQNTFPNQPPKKELKIYRKPIHRGATLCFIGGTISFMGSALFILKSRGDSALSNRTPTFLFGVLPAVGLFAIGLKEQQKWNKKINKPILIFDEKGFTYEKSMGWPKDRHDVRYLWKNVISHWVSKVINEYGSVIKEHWNYHIEGVDDIVSINAKELDIPNKLQASIQSVRQGSIRALHLVNF
jgi:hypothetical protein